MARISAGSSAGMAYPTTLALIAALWSGPGRTKSIALWSALGGAIASLGPLVAGGCCSRLLVGSVFLVTLPLAVVALVMAWRVRPGPRQRVDRAGRQPRRHPLGRAGRRRWSSRSTSRRCPNKGTLVAGARRRRDRRRGRLLLCASGVPRTRSTTWTSRRGASSGSRPARASSCSARSWARCSSASSSSRTCSATRRSRPAPPSCPRSFFMVLVAPRSAKLVETRGARASRCSCGYVFLLLALPCDAAALGGGQPVLAGRLAYALIGIGVGLAGTPASHSLTGSVPVRRAGMASGTADLQRDLGGAIMQSIFGALLTAGYASRRRRRRSPRPPTRPGHRQRRGRADQVVRRRRGRRRAVPAVRHPDHGRRASRRSCNGDEWAYTAGLVAVMLGAVLVYFFFPQARRTSSGCCGDYARRGRRTRRQPAVRTRGLRQGRR